MYDCIDRWADYLGKERGLAPSSVTLYKRYMRMLSAATDDPRVLDTETIREWLHSFGDSPSSFCSRLTSVSSFYKWLVRTKLRVDDPTVAIQAPRTERRLPRPVEDLDIALDRLDALDKQLVESELYGVLVQHTRKVGETRAMAVFLCETGLRISEAVALQLPCPAPEQLRVRGKGRKDAIVPLTERAREAWNFLEGRWPIGARATQRRFSMAGFSPHQCRHYRGTSMAAAGCDLGDIRAMLRHESMDTTLGYAAWSTDRVRNALAKVG